MVIYLVRLKIILCFTGAPLSVQLETLRLGLESAVESGMADALKMWENALCEDALKELSLKSYSRLSLNCG